MNAPPANDERLVIEAQTYQPYEGEEATSGLSAWQIALAISAILVAAIFYFLFTARSVALTFSAEPNSVDVDGGFSFELGGVYLLRQGTYTVNATAPGHKPLTATIEVGPDRNQDKRLNFTPLPGLITFNTDPPGVVVTVDGSELGVTPLVDQPIEAGQREISYTHARYRPHAEVLEVTGREQQQTFEVAMRPNWGDIEVNSSPAGAAIQIDGEDSGLVTPATVEILAGEREVAVVLDGFRTGRQRIVVAAEVAESLPPFQLVQADARLVVESSPSGAGITLNGDYIGQAPLEVEVKAGNNYRVEAILRGYARRAQRVDLTRGATTNVSLNLRREVGTVEFAVEPTEAQLKVNGRTIADANTRLTLPTDPQKIEISLDGYAGYTTTVTPKPGLTQAVRVKLLTVAEARRRALRAEYATADGTQMLLLTPGKVQLGASRREPGRRANETLRSATLTRLFYLATTEVTNKQFKAFATGHDSGEFEGNTLAKDQQPAVQLGWHDAALYCNWLSRQEGLPPFYSEEFGKVTGRLGGIGYRLPTEAEWTWAARQINDEQSLRYPWGDNLPPPDRHGNYADRAAAHLVGRIIYGYNDNYVATAPVRTYEPNHHGLYDLGGNVAEWIQDFYEIPSKDDVVDPLGPKDGEYHVIKGSSWMHGTVTDLRLSFRDYGIDGRPDVGFRVARYAE